MAKIRALISNSPCNISRCTVYITFATMKISCILIFYVIHISIKYYEGKQKNRLKNSCYGENTSVTSILRTLHIYENIMFIKILSNK